MRAPREPPKTSTTRRVRRQPERGCVPPRGRPAATPPGSAGRRRGTSPRAGRAAARGRRGPRTARRAGSRDRDARRPRSARTGSARAARRAPSAPRRSRRAPSTTSGLRRRRIARQATGAASARAQRAHEAAGSGTARKPGDGERVELVAAAQERAAPRRDPATRRTSPARPAAAGLLRRRVPARRARPSRRPRSGTAAAARPPSRAMLRRTPTPTSITTRLEPP